MRGRVGEVEVTQRVEVIDYRRDDFGFLEAACCLDDAWNVVGILLPVVWLTYM